MRLKLSDGSCSQTKPCSWPGFLQERVVCIFLMARLALHAVENHLLHVRIPHSGDVEQGVERREIPWLEAVPHRMHGSRAKGNKIGKGVLEEEDLMSLRVVRANEARLHLEVRVLTASTAYFAQIVPEKYR